MLPWLRAQTSDGNMAAIDTQLRYNWTAQVGAMLKKAAHITRDQLWITSKIDPKAYCAAPNVTHAAAAMIRESLQQLGVAHVDLLLLHEVRQCRRIRMLMHTVCTTTTPKL